MKTKKRPKFVHTYSTKNHEVFLCGLEDSFMVLYKMHAALLYAKNGLQQFVLGCSEWCGGSAPRRATVRPPLELVHFSTEPRRCQKVVRPNLINHRRNVLAES